MSTATPPSQPARPAAAPAASPHTELQIAGGTLPPPAFGRLQTITLTTAKTAAPRTSKKGRKLTLVFSPQPQAPSQDAGAGPSKRKLVWDGSVETIPRTKPRTPNTAAQETDRNAQNAFDWAGFDDGLPYAATAKSGGDDFGGLLVETNVVINRAEQLSGLLTGSDNGMKFSAYAEGR
jgi:hypothetical protein